MGSVALFLERFLKRIAERVPDWDRYSLKLVLMKHLSVFLSLALAVTALSCEGPVGPPGPPGFDGNDGLDGVNILGQVYDIEGDFTPPNYSILSVFSEDAPSLEVFETDVVLVYILWEQLEDDLGGPPIDVWRLLPQTLLIPGQGTLQYNYDHTFLDVSIFLDADFELSTLAPGDTDNQIFRIAILPADGLSGAKLDVSNMQAVLDHLQIQEDRIPRIQAD
jgi:hypothetical protein